MRTLILVLIIMLLISFAINCATHVHTIGKGPSTDDVVKVKARQWYILWGLIPINTVDTKTMAGNAADYEIVTAVKPIDFLINIVTNLISVNCRSVTVTKQKSSEKQDIALTKQLANDEK